MYSTHLTRDDALEPSQGRKGRRNLDSPKRNISRRVLPAHWFKKERSGGGPQKSRGARLHRIQRTPWRSPDLLADSQHLAPGGSQTEENRRKPQTRQAQGKRTRNP